MKFEHYGRGLAKGMMMTLKHALRRPITTQYPDEKLVVSRRFRGYELVWYEDLCTGCATCAKACPQGNIEIVTSKEGDRYKVLKFELDTGRCMNCGLCVEACPYKALYMGRGYERARYRRGQLVLAMNDLKPSDERKRSAYYYPELEAEMPEQTLLVYRK